LCVSHENGLLVVVVFMACRSAHLPTELLLLNWLPTPAVLEVHTVTAKQRACLPTSGGKSALAVPEIQSWNDEKASAEILRRHAVSTK